MRNFLKGIASGGSSLSNGFIALAIISLIVLGCTCNEKEGFKFGSKDSNTAEKPSGDDSNNGNKDEVMSEDKIPSDEALQELVKTTLMNFNDAVQSKNFSDFHKTISSTWRRRSRPSQFKKGFRQFIDKRIDIGDIRSKDANFSPEPELDKRKYKRPALLVTGTYDDSRPKVKFDLDYVFESDEWKLNRIEVRTKR